MSFIAPISSTASTSFYSDCIVPNSTIATRRNFQNLKPLDANLLDDGETPEGKVIPNKEKTLGFVVVNAMAAAKERELLLEDNSRAPLNEILWSEMSSEPLYEEQFQKEAHKEALKLAENWLVERVGAAAARCTELLKQEKYPEALKQAAAMRKSRFDLCRDLILSRQFDELVSIIKIIGPAYKKNPTDAQDIVNRLMIANQYDHVATIILNEFPGEDFQSYILGICRSLISKNRFDLAESIARSKLNKDSLAKLCYNLCGSPYCYKMEAIAKLITGQADSTLLQTCKDLFTLEQDTLALIIATTNLDEKSLYELCKFLISLKKFDAAAKAIDSAWLLDSSYILEICQLFVEHEEYDPIVSLSLKLTSESKEELYKFLSNFDLFDLIKEIQKVHQVGPHSPSGLENSDDSEFEDLALDDSDFEDL